MLIKFIRPLTVYISPTSDFTFRDGYSYECQKVDDGLIIWNVDRSVEVKLGVDEMMEWVE